MWIWTRGSPAAPGVAVEDASSGGWACSRAPGPVVSKAIPRSTVKVTVPQEAFVDLDAWLSGGAGGGGGVCFVGGLGLQPCPADARLYVAVACLGTFSATDGWRRSAFIYRGSSLPVVEIDSFYSNVSDWEVIL